MYFLVEKAGCGEVKIIDNFDKIGHKMVILMKYLNQNNIQYLEKKEDMDGEGLFCVPSGLNHYKVYNNVKADDGFFLKGYTYYEYQYDVAVVYYKLTENNIIEIMECIEKNYK